MKFNRLSAFTLGVVITAVSVGAVTFANAAGDATLKACANKTTGAMRYIAKGSCKKTETSLSWSQMGPQGLPGATGATGAKGETGTPGTNFYAVDATGKNLGPILGANSGTFTILIGERIWSAVKTTYEIGAFGTRQIEYYSDSLCTRPFIHESKSSTVSTQDIYMDSIRVDRDKAKAYSPVGNAITWTDRVVYWYNMEEPCQLLTSSGKTLHARNYALFDTVEIEKPTYTAPLILVAR